jgi:hypothetical protein
VLVKQAAWIPSYIKEYQNERPFLEKSSSNQLYRVDLLELPELVLVELELGLILFIVTHVYNCCCCIDMGLSWRSML